MTLYTWSWLFLFGYVLAMVGFGVLGNRRVTGADDYAVARAGYGPAVLAVAFASTAVSGRTFVGLPALTYTYGMSTLWIAFLYAVGLYTGILICQRTIGRYGNVSGARSIPEYLGERYRSEALRISAAILFVLIHSEALSGHWPPGTSWSRLGAGLISMPQVPIRRRRWPG